MKHQTSDLKKVLSELERLLRENPELVDPLAQALDSALDALSPESIPGYWELRSSLTTPGEDAGWKMGSAGRHLMKGTAGADTINGTRSHDAIRGGEGGDLLSGGKGRDALYGEDGDDRLNGGSGGDRLLGGSGEDRLFGDRGWDRLKGGVGNDQLAGGNGRDRLMGGEGDDRLDGGAGRDRLDGGAGIDVLLGGAGRDVLGGKAGSEDYLGSGNVYEGGAGDDTLRGTLEGDLYKFNLGDGRDRIQEWLSGSDAAPSGTDILRFGEGINPDDVNVERNGNDLIFHLSNGTDAVRVQDWFKDGNYQLERIEFVDGTVWSGEYVNRLTPASDIGRVGGSPTRGVQSLWALESEGSGREMDSGGLEGGGKSSASSAALLERSGPQASPASAPPASLFTGSDRVASQVQQLIQAMAEFNPPTEMSWSQPIQDNPSALQQILAQYWDNTNGK